MMVSKNCDTEIRVCKQEKAVTYEYLTVSKNTASESSSESMASLGHPPTPRPTGAPHHQLAGLNTKSGLFVAPLAGTYRVSFQVDIVRCLEIKRITSLCE